MLRYIFRVQVGVLVVNINWSFPFLQVWWNWSEGGSVVLDPSPAVPLTGQWSGLALQNSAAAMFKANYMDSNCLRCGKTVYPTDKIGPLKDYSFFHSGCFRCVECSSKLTLKERTGSTFNSTYTRATAYVQLYIIVLLANYWPHYCHNIDDDIGRRWRKSDPEQAFSKQWCGSGIRLLFDPLPWFLDPGLKEIPVRDSGLTSRSYFLELSTALTIFWDKNTSILDADPDAGSGIFSVLNPRSGIQNKHPGSVTLTV